MGTRAAHTAHLEALDPAAWPDYLLRNSGLPGPRANLELVQAVADVGTEPIFIDLISLGDAAPHGGVDDGEEYLTVCGVVGLGQVIASHAAAGRPREDLVAALHDAAADARWRVREAVAMAVQRVGDADLAAALSLARRWSTDGDPLVQRAAVAGLCEPRLLREPDMAAAAVDLCARVTESLARRPASERRRPPVRTLRQALGYCWSVAVAADPAAGLDRFLALGNPDELRPAQPLDADVAWIIRENRRKKRLASLLPA